MSIHKYILLVQKEWSKYGAIFYNDTPAKKLNLIESVNTIIILYQIQNYLQIV